MVTGRGCGILLALGDVLAGYPHARFSSLLVCRRYPSSILSQLKKRQTQRLWRWPFKQSPSPSDINNRFGAHGAVARIDSGWRYTACLQRRCFECSGRGTVQKICLTMEEARTTAGEIHWHERKQNMLGSVECWQRSDRNPLVGRTSDSLVGWFRSRGDWDFDLDGVATVAGRISGARGVVRSIRIIPFA